MHVTGIINPSVRAIGFWSAVAVTVEVILFLVGLLISQLNLAFAASFLLAPTFVTLMVAIHHSAPSERKVWSQLGLAFAVIYAVNASLNYYLQLTVVQTNYLRAPADVMTLFVFEPGSLLFAQDMLGYGFMCAATLAAGPAFAGGRLETWIRRLFILHAVVFLVPTLIFPALPLPASEAGAGSRELGELIALLSWPAYFAPTAALVAVFFRRLGSTSR